MTESYALTAERAEQDRNPDRRSHLYVAREEWAGDEPIEDEVDPHNWPADWVLRNVWEVAS